MVCIFAILIGGNFVQMELEVKQILWQNGNSVKAVYELPKDADAHYYNRGVQIVKKGDCITIEQK